MIIKATGGLGRWRTSGDHPNYIIIENSYNTEKGPGDLRRLAVTQTQMPSASGVNKTKDVNHQSH